MFEDLDLIVLCPDGIRNLSRLPKEPTVVEWSTCASAASSTLH